jgi:isopentenyldiphosphate isomerase
MHVILVETCNSWICGKNKEDDSALSHLVDIYSNGYEHLGQASKEEAHANGLWHRVFTCLVVNSRNKSVILQKKVPDKYIFNRPDYIDVSVGGHYKAGEALEDGIRELDEELGLRRQFDELISIGVRQTSATLAPNYINNEFQHIFLLDEKRDLEYYKPSSEEVSGLVEIQIEDGIKLLLRQREQIAGKFVSFANDPQSKLHIQITTEDFVPNYLKTDQFFLRLFVAAHRYISADNVDLLFW